MINDNDFTLMYLYIMQRINGFSIVEKDQKVFMTSFPSNYNEIINVLLEYEEFQNIILYINVDYINGLGQFNDTLFSEKLEEYAEMYDKDYIYCPSNKELVFPFSEQELLDIRRYFVTNVHKEVLDKMTYFCSAIVAVSKNQTFQNDVNNLSSESDDSKIKIMYCN